MAASEIKFWHDPETDIFYLSLSDTPAVDSEEVAENIRIEYGPGGEIVGLEIHRLSQLLARSLMQHLEKLRHQIHRDLDLSGA
ncbi:DUF2283 domain-containing protein [Thermosulfurimonas sp.]|uniref:DUF2283 domain-containing protein n=1 Tax=Thermosulfurimonas sp. TaxID=2080236 RepID=UPI0025FF6286|nr:DUF2283 domain-containing protein [Thermosulfurimonas sp.]